MAKTSDMVGSIVPTEDDQAKINAGVAALKAELLRFGCIISPEQRGSLLKPRVGAEEHMLQVSQLAREKGINIDGMSIDSMTQDMQVGKVALRVEAQVTDLLQLASDTRLAAYGEAWQSFLGYYGVLVTMSARDPDLASRLRPVIEFMSVGSSRAKKPADK